MVLIAFSLQDQVEKYGVYVGIAAFFGLAVLTLLYFAQAREVKRLREWAGRAPERAAELEAAVAEHAEEVRRVPATPVPAPQPVAAQAVAAPVAVATNGAVKLQPAEVAALAFARAAGVHEPHEPTHHPVPAPAAAAVATAPPTEVAAAGAAIATGEPAAAQAINGGGGIPAPATPAARRADPPPLPPRRPSGPPRRAPAPPPRRDSNTRAVVLTAVIGVLVLAGAVFLLTRVVGGGDEPTTAERPNVVATPTPSDDTEAKATATASPALTKQNVLVGVYNGTQQTGLAAEFQSTLLAEGYRENNVGADTAPAEQQRQTSVVMYKRGAKPAAQSVAEALGISDVKPIDDATQTLIANAPQRWNVVAIVGSDKTN